MVSWIMFVDLVGINDSKLPGMICHPSLNRQLPPLGAG